MASSSGSDKKKVKDKEEDEKRLYPLSTVVYLEQLQSLWQRDVLCDATVIADGREFKVHRVVLAAASKYFERVFSSDWQESRTGRVVLDGISALSLEILLNSVYTQELQLSPEIVLGVLAAAHRLEFTEVFKCCENYIEEIVAPPNCLDFLLAGETYSMSKVLHSSERCLLENFSVVSIQDKFLELSGDALKNYIKNSSLQCETEMDVFRAVIRWLKYDNEARKNKATVLMRHVRFGLISLSHLLGDVWREPIMNSNSACQEMLRKAIEFCSKPNDQPFLKEEWSTPRNTKSWLVVIGGQWDYTKLLMTPPMVVPFEDPKREEYSIDDNMKPLSNTYQDGGAAVCLNHYLFITGGVHTYPASSNDAMSEAHSSSNNKQNVSNTMWRLNSVELRCEQMTNMMVARKFHAAFLHKETIVVAGGKNDAKKSLCSTEIYTIKENSWELGAYLPSALISLAGCSHKDHAYVSGGMLVKKHRENSTKKFYKYDVILKEWIEKASMLHERCEHAMASTAHGIFVLGGVQLYRHDYDNRSHPSHISNPEHYDTGADQWTAIKVELYVARSSAIIRNDKIYLVGGREYKDDDRRRDFDERDQEFHRLNNIKCFDTQTKSLQKMSIRFPIRIEDSIMAVMPLPSNRDYEENRDEEDDDAFDDNYDSNDQDDDDSAGYSEPSSPYYSPAHHPSSPYSLGSTSQSDSDDY